MIRRGERRTGPRRRRIPTLLLLATLAMALACTGDESPEAARPPPAPRTPPTRGDSGLTVERVRDGSAGERAGILAGDRLSGWRRDGAPEAGPPGSGTLATEFDLLDLAIEQVPRGEMTLVGSRDGVSASWPLPPGELGLGVRPALTPELAAEVGKASDLRARDEDVEAARLLTALAERFAAERPGLAAWLHYRAAGAHLAGGDGPAAAESYRAGITAATAAGDLQAEAHLRYFLANLLSRRLGEPAAADREAVAVAEIWSDRGADLAVASALHLRGEMARRRGDLRAAEASLGLALERKRRWAPNSLSLARTLSVLGKTVATGGDLERAEELMREAADIRRRLDPDGIDLAHSLSALGTVRLIRGDLAGGEVEIRRALERFEADDPRSQHVSVMLNNLGVVAIERGDLVAAERFYRRALELTEAVAPGGLGSSTLLNNLAGLARLRGDLDSAEELGRESLAIRRRLAPGSLDVAVALTSLSLIAIERGELETGREQLREALEIQTALAPDSLEVARTEGDLGMVALERGELEAAERHLRRAESLYRRLAPRGYQLGRVLQRRGDVAEAAGDPPAAERLYRDAADRLARSAPGTSAEADALWGLARVLRDTGRGEEAIDVYRRAEEALETQAGRLGGTQEIRSGFRARYRDLYREHLELELELGRPREAFSVLERSRARELLAMLAERDLVFAADLPAALDADRRRAMAAVDRAQEALLSAPAGAGPDEVESRLRELSRARRRLQEVADRVRAAAPRLAALTEPVPATVEQALGDLDEGTVALVYSVGVERSELFVLGPGDRFRVAPVAAGGEDLRQRVERLRHLLSLGPSSGPASGAVSADPLAAQARALYRLLVTPAAAEVAGARRLLIVPDGALHLLPFAALDGGGESAPAYLGVSLPLYTAASMSVFSEIRRRRADRPRPRSVAAFADPESPFGAADDGAADPAALRSAAPERLPPLAASRNEASAVARGFPEGHTYFGAEATEARARAASAADSHLHFAVHGFVDERFPLSSGLILARDPGGGEGGNGLLQAWEIFESVRSDADLVTLSACETALGTEVAGEGLLGLTRAFQYAGARAVLASLWRVPDRSTSALMDRFYRHLGDGLPPAEALRAARAELVAGPVAPPPPPAEGWWSRLGRDLGLGTPPPAEDFSHPWHWAGFRLDGDWR